MWLFLGPRGLSGLYNSPAQRQPGKKWWIPAKNNIFFVARAVLNSCPSEAHMKANVKSKTKVKEDVHVCAMEGAGMGAIACLISARAASPGQTHGVCFGK